MAITLNQFRYFCEIAETRHFGRAAERLHISQPPLSRQIALLEQEVGAKLLERTPHGVELTPAGSQFLMDAQRVVSTAAQAQRNAAAAARGDFGELAVGFTMCAAYSVVPPLLRKFKTSLPAVHLRMLEMMPSALEASLVAGTIDVGIGFPGVTAPEIDARCLLREPLDLVVPREHRCAKARRIAVADLAQEAFLIVPREQAPALHDSIVQRCREAGFAPTIALEVYLQQTIISFVAEGFGIAFVPTSMQRARAANAVLRPLPEPPMIDQMLFWLPANQNPCLAKFLNIAGVE